MSSLAAIHWHALNLSLSGELWKLLPFAKVLGGPEALFKSEENRLLGAGMDPSLAARIIAGRARIKPAIEWERLEGKGIRCLSIEDPSYPRALKEIHSPPPLIYVRGEAAVLREKSLGVVGSRKISGYGKEAVKSLVPEIVDYGLPVVSGLAFGVDAAALSCCMDSGGVPVSVLASSLDWKEITPQSNLRLAEEVLERGCLVSENPPGRSAHKQMFPLRNRIISGLSLGVVVIEAALESGSLITARYALEQNREVFAVPGSIFSGGSAGTIELIKKGAKCVSSFQDIAAEFGWDLRPAQAALDFSDPTHAKICEHAARSPLGANDLISLTGLPAEDVLAALAELEIKGVLRRSMDGMYAKIK
jgi:DNA processing protein